MSNSHRIPRIWCCTGCRARMGARARRYWNRTQRRAERRALTRDLT